MAAKYSAHSSPSQIKRLTHANTHMFSDSSITHFNPADEQVSHVGDPLQPGNVELPREKQAYPEQLERVSEVDASAGSDGNTVSVAIQDNQAPCQVGTGLLSTLLPTPYAPGRGQTVIGDSQDVTTLTITHPNGNTSSKLAFEICRSDKQVMWDGDHDFYEVIHWALQTSGLNPDSSLPLDIAPDTSATSDDPSFTVGSSPRSFVWEGFLALQVLPNFFDKLLPFGTLSTIALTCCKISIPDCLHLLRHAPGVEELELNQLADVRSIFPENRDRQTILLKSFTLTSSINPMAFFEKIRVKKLSHANLSFLKASLPNTPSFTLGDNDLAKSSQDMPYIDRAELVDYLIRQLDPSENPNHTIIINKEVVVMNGQRLQRTEPTSVPSLTAQAFHKPAAQVVPLNEQAIEEGEDQPTLTPSSTHAQFKYVRKATSKGRRPPPIMVSAPCSSGESSPMPMSATPVAQVDSFSKQAISEGYRKAFLRKITYDRENQEAGSRMSSTGEGESCQNLIDFWEDLVTEDDMEKRMNRVCAEIQTLHIKSRIDLEIISRFLDGYSYPACVATASQLKEDISNRRYWGDTHETFARYQRSKAEKEPLREEWR